MPFLVFMAIRFGKKYRPLSLKVQSQLATLTTAVEQNLRGSRIVKAYAQEDAEIERFTKENNQWFNLSFGASKLQAINVPMLFLIANLSIVAIILYGGQQVINNQLTIGAVIAFITYVGQLVDPVRRLGMIIPAVAIAGSAAERVFDILDTISEVKDEPGSRDLPELKGNVKFDHVYFSYGDRPVLSDVNFEVKNGQVIALLGATGSGKSSIISLLPRFYDPTKGKILFDGYDIRTVSLQSLRSQIGVVLQETTLFATTIKENIAFGCKNALDEDIIEASKAAQAHEFIMRMANGYETHVGERGVTLSGGQKQRLAIARAILYGPTDPDTG